MNIFLKDTSQQSLCVHRELSVRGWTDRLRCRQISGLPLGLSAPPTPGQNYADEGLGCNKVMNGGTA